MIEHRYGAHPGKGCNRSRVRTLLADHDPLSRRVLSDLLSESGELDVIARVDSHDPLEEWPLRQAEVVVLGVSPLEHLVDTVRELASRKVTVLLIGVDWTTDSLDAVLGAGAAGCLVKDAELSGLVTAVQAVASGHVVWVPITSSTSCDQVIFVDHATDVSLFSDAVQVEVDRLG